MRYALGKLSNDRDSSIQWSFTSNSNKLSLKEFDKTTNVISNNDSSITSHRKPNSVYHDTQIVSEHTHKNDNVLESSAFQDSVVDSVTCEHGTNLKASPNVVHQSDTARSLENGSINLSLENTNVSSSSSSNDSSSMPSDQQTTGDMESSYKESCASSKESSESSRIHTYHIDEQKIKVNSLYEKLFVQLTLGFISSTNTN